MAWDATTMFAEIKPGTRMFIYERSQIVGRPHRSPVGTFEMLIELAAGPKVATTVEVTSPATAILTMPNGVRYQMTPRQDGEFDSGVSFRGGNMTGEDWIVRSQIV